MYARTYYNTLITQVSAGAFKALAALCVLLIISCSSDTTLSETDEGGTDSTDPMSFTCQMTQSEQLTRAVTLLQSDFAVSTYKAFATSRQYTVMERYHVEYKTTGSAWEGSLKP